MQTIIRLSESAIYPTHPEARCGKCPECQVVESTKRIILATSAPAGPGITDREREMWNKVLLDNRCRCRLVRVHHNSRHMVGRLVDSNRRLETYEILVDTDDFGQLILHKSNVEEWYPPDGN